MAWCASPLCLAWPPGCCMSLSLSMQWMVQALCSQPKACSWRSSRLRFQQPRVSWVPSCAGLSR
eukprot:10801213-Lingulodinium_polyedra.AAC.1